MRTLHVCCIYADAWQVLSYICEVKWYIGPSWDILRRFCLLGCLVSDVNSLSLAASSLLSSPSPLPIENTQQQTKFYFKLKAFVRSKYWISSHVIRLERLKYQEYFTKYNLWHLEWISMNFSIKKEFKEDFMIFIWNTGTQTLIVSGSWVIVKVNWVPPNLYQNNSI